MGGIGTATTRLSSEGRVRKLNLDIPMLEQWRKYQKFYLFSGCSTDIGQGLKSINRKLGEARRYLQVSYPFHIMDYVVVKPSFTRPK
jgi:hypothetical protein